MFSQCSSGEARGQHGLQVNDDGAQASGHTKFDAEEDSAEVARVKEQSGDGGMKCLRSIWKTLPQNQYQQQQCEHCQQQANREKRERFGIRQSEFRADVTGAPKQHE